MSTWRSKALELFPDMHESIIHAEDYNILWRDIHRQFRAALASGREDAATPFFKYAAWTLGLAPQTRTMPEVSQAAADTFYEFADKLHCWIDRYDFMHAQKGLRYFLGESKYAEFEHRFLEHTDGYIKKGRPCAEN
jgi:hypothetical protein